MNTYKILIKCKNCVDHNWHDIEKGITSKEYMEKTICARCDCTLDGKIDKEENGTTK